MKITLTLSFFLFSCAITWISSQQLVVIGVTPDQTHNPPGSSSTGVRQAPLWVRMADTALKLWNLSGPGEEIWNYQRGTLLYGIQKVWVATNDTKYFSFLQRRTDAFLTENGSIPTYNLEDYALDAIRSGVDALFLYKHTQQEKYRAAAEVLHRQLTYQPRTHEGGYWHKLIYTWQMWLDGFFMAQPFRAQYAHAFNDTWDWDVFHDIAMQFMWMEDNTRDNKTGLFYHGWDESRQEAWADPVTGRSSAFWGRGVGWYAMALVDALDLFPLQHPRRNDMIHILQRLAMAIARVQDPVSNVWWQVLDQGGRKGNYLESSASCMFVYTLAKGAHQGYLSSHYLLVAKLGYEGIKAKFIQVEPSGGINLTDTTANVGLGGGHHTNGTYEYYISVSVVTNDARGIGPFLLASLELETL